MGIETSVMLEQLVQLARQIGTAEEFITEWAEEVSQIRRESSKTGETTISYEITTKRGGIIDTHSCQILYRSWWEVFPFASGNILNEYLDTIYTGADDGVDNMQKERDKAREETLQRIAKEIAEANAEAEVTGEYDPIYEWVKGTLDTEAIVAINFRGDKEIREYEITIGTHDSEFIIFYVLAQRITCGNISIDFYGSDIEQYKNYLETYFETVLLDME